MARGRFTVGGSFLFICIWRMYGMCPFGKQLCCGSHNRIQCICCNFQHRLGSHPSFSHVKNHCLLFGWNGDPLVLYGFVILALISRLSCLLVPDCCPNSCAMFRLWCNSCVLSSASQSVFCRVDVVLDGCASS